MSDLISREEAVEAVKNEMLSWLEGDSYDYRKVVDAIMDLPTIDAVEVVRCKDCKWGKEVCGNIECSVDMNVPPEYHGYYWFCPNGE